jgi:HK97 family phage portal protein
LGSGLNMSLWSRLFGREQKSLVDLPASFRWPESRTGFQVSALSALEVSTVQACVRAIAEGCSQVPVYVHSVDERGVLGPKVAHPILETYARRPNQWQSGFEFRETLLTHLALVGNAFVYVSRTGDGRILELIPIEPGKVFVTREMDMSLTYRVSFEDGKSLTLRGRDIWHLRGPSWNTWMGLDAVKIAREAIGLSMATEAAHASFHKNGAQVSGLLSLAEKISPEKFNLLGAWLDKHAPGQERSGKPLILDSGAKWQSFAMTGVDAQHVETRKFQVLEICRHFRIEPMIVGAADTPTHASAEQLRQSHVVNGLMPWAERIEQSAAINLFNPSERVELRHDFNGLMRGVAKDRAEFYAKALGSGGSPAWMTPNEVRATEGHDPVEGGDELPRPTNVAPQPAQSSEDDDVGEDDTEDAERAPQ